MVLLEKIRKKARESVEDSSGSHDWEHTQRVYNIAIAIGEKEGADMTILKYAALLHDIGRAMEISSKGKICHAEYGAMLAKAILLDHGIEPEIAESVFHCIETHRFRNEKIPESTEAKVLYDADKIDAIGAVGVGRAFLFAGEVGAKLHDKDVDIENTKPYTEDDTAYREYLVKLRKIKDRMQTRTGKQMAEGRHEFMKQFFDRINLEVDGKI